MLQQRIMAVASCRRRHGGFRMLEGADTRARQAAVLLELLPVRPRRKML